MEQNKIQLPLIAKATILMLFWILLFFVLTEIKNFLYPIFLAALFSYLLYPLAKFLEKHKIPRVIANLISIVIGIAIIYGVVLFIYKNLQKFLIDIPTMEKQAISNLTELLNGLREGLGIDTASGTPVQDSVMNAITSLKSGLSEYLSSTFHSFFAVFIMPVFIFFFLYKRNKIERFIYMLTPKRNHERTDRILERANLVIMKYMTGIAVVVAILAVLNSLGFMIIGLKYAVLWGLIAAMFSFIPYFGTFIGYSIPILIAILTGTSPHLVVSVVIQMIIVVFIEHNLLTPNIVGGYVRISPFIIILSVLFGGAVWGIPGMFLIVPIIAMAKILCDEVPELNAYGYLIGEEGTEEFSLSTGKVKKFFNFRKKKS
jgi:predicted PurR-regulated permease PerM